jgi:hypothetical protein
MMLDVLKGAGWVFLVFFGSILFGWGLGTITSKLIFPVQPTVQPVWYCIEGKLYEKISDVYVTVSPARSCLPVIKD